METKTGTHKVFTFDDLTVFFKHTDYHGFVHPYNYFEWTSYVREAFFSQMCPDFRQILKSPIKMMTTKIDCIMHFDSIFGDKFEARFSAARIKKASCDIIVRFFNRRIERIVCETRHTLVFVDFNTQDFTLIPAGIRNAIISFQEDNKLIAS